MSDAAAPKKIVKAKKPKAEPTHPPVATMVNDALVALKERKGSSLAAIKKYIAANNKVDVDKLNPFIKRYLKSAVTAGKLVQTKGTGATGSFKMGKEEKPKKPVVKKVKTPKKAAKKPAAKKSKTPKKAAKKEKTPKKAVKKVKTPKKAAKKPKSPAKKAVAKKVKADKAKPKAANPKAAKPAKK